MPGYHPYTAPAPYLYHPSAFAQPMMPVPQAGYPYNPQFPAFPLASQATALAPSAPVNYPKISQWLEYLDRHPDRSDRMEWTQYRSAFEREKFMKLNQLVSSRITVENLAQWLGIPRGCVDLIIQYAEEDITLLKAGKFDMEGVTGFGEVG